MTEAELRLMLGDRKLTPEQDAFVRAWADPVKRRMMLEALQEPLSVLLSAAACVQVGQTRKHSA